MIIRNIKEIEGISDDERSLTIEDRKASLTEINNLLERFTLLDSLKIETPISSLPDGLNRLRLRSLVINAKNSDFVFDDKLIPNMTERLALSVRSVDHLPDRLWAMPQFSIEAKNLGNQNFENTKGHKNLQYSLDIDNLENIPIVQAYRVNIKSQTLRRIPTAFFEVNRDFQGSLTLQCNVWGGAEVSGGVLPFLTVCSIHTGSNIDRKDLSFIPSTISYLSLDGKVISSFNVN